MQRYAKLIGDVVDVISFDPDRDSAGNPTSDWIPVPDDVYGGYIHEESTFSPPPEPEPEPEVEVPSEEPPEPSNENQE